MKLLIIISSILALLITGCGDSSGSSSNRTIKAPKNILTESQKLKYITPTIYFVPDYSKVGNLSCSDQVTLNISVSKTNVQKMIVCKKVAANCAMQGSCYIELQNKKVMINYRKKVASDYYFKIVDTAICPHGFGDSNDGLQSFKNMCLDPFHSVAADFSFYKLGTVIYIASIAGTKLPDGTTHDGYFIVRDSGGGIDGRGRFDFFTGTYPLGSINPFSNLGLGGESNFEYKVVSESEAEQVKSHRGFPGLN